MPEPSSKIIPNSFQTPNFFVDECMSFLTGNEYKCLSFLARKTFGWQKRSDRISKSQIMEATGLGAETVDKAMCALVEFGIVLRLAENNAAKNNGVEWGLQMDGESIHFDLMRKRLLDQEERNRIKTSKARQQRMNQGGGDVEQPHLEKASVEQKTGGGGDVEQTGGRDVQQTGGGDVQQTGGGDVGQSPQKPIKAKESHMGASAPVRDDSKSETAPEQAIADFPPDCQEAASLMRSLFKVIPPARPAAHERGSDFADWIKSIRALNQLAARYNVPLDQAFALTWADWNKNAFRVARPGALLKSMTAVLAKTKLREGPSAPAQPEAAERVIVPNPFPRPANLPSSKPRRK